MCQCNTQTAIERIRAFAKAQGWAKSRLAAECKLQDTTLRKFYEPSWNPTLRVLRRIEAVIPANFSPPDEAAS